MFLKLINFIMAKDFCWFDDETCNVTTYKDQYFSVLKSSNSSNVVFYGVSRFIIYVQIVSYI